jgi:WD40 repeat protein
MAQHGTKSRSTSRKKIAVSFIIRDVEEKFNRAGVNVVRVDPTNQVLYTAGRDSIIRAWDIQDSDRGKIKVGVNSAVTFSHGQTNYLVHEISGAPYGLGQQHCTLYGWEEQLVSLCPLGLYVNIVVCL